MIKTLIVLTALGLAQGAQRSLTVPHPDCPATGHALLPHEYDCTKFYYCEEGDKFVAARDCPPNTEFSATQQVCIHPEQADCQLPGYPTQEATSSTPENNDTACPCEFLENGCPADFSVHLLLPHETSCRKFYYCVNGQKVVSQCSRGSVFDPDTQNCAAAGSIDRSCEDEDSSSEEDSITEENQSSEEVELLPNGCPADWSIFKYLPHDHYCNKYYQCVNGELVERQCASGTHFNPETERCDHPSIVNCTLPGGDSNSEEVDTSEAPESTTSPPMDLLDNGCPLDGSINWMVPHEEDCGQFYHCVWGSLILGTCPNGLHFSLALQRCESPAIAGCTCTGGCFEDSAGESSSEEDIPIGDDPNGCDAGNDCNNDNDDNQCTGNDCNNQSSSEEDLPISNDPNDCSDGNDCNNECSGNDCDNECSGNDCNNECSGNDCDNECTGNDCNNECSGNECDNECSGNDCNNECSGNDCDNECTGNDCNNECSGNECDNECSGNDCNNECSGNDCDNECTGNDCNNECSGNECDNECSGNDCNNECSGNDCDNECTGNDCNNECSGNECDNECSDNDCNTASNSEEDLPVGNDPNDCGTGNDCDINDSGCTGDDCDNECSGNQCDDNANEPDCPAPVDPQQICEEKCNFLPWAHEDCDKYWQCDGNQPLLLVCSEGLHFNPSTHTCDFACNVGCVRESIQTTAGDDGIIIYIPWSLYGKSGDLLKLFNV